MTGVPAAGLWLALLAVLAVLAVFVLRRMSQLIARTRALEQFQRDAYGLDARFGAAADPLVGQLDEIRRRAGDARVVAAGLPGAADALRSAAAEATALRAPRPLQELAVGLARELERAVRATELVEHGLDALLTVRGNRELEAQTSLKRGALNLRHARSAFHQLAVEIWRLRPADLAVRVPVRSDTPARAVRTYLVDSLEDEPDRS